MDKASTQLLLDAVARNCAAVVSLPSSGMLRHTKSRFLAAEDESFWVESDPHERALVQQLIETGIPVGVAFKATATKTVFTTRVVELRDQYAINAQVTVEAIRLLFPADVKTVQRRSNYRVHIPNECELTVRAWRIAEHAILRDRPIASAEVPMKVVDLSAGGMGVLISPREDSAKIVADQRLRVSLKYGETEAIVEGRARHLRENPDKSLKAGVQFKKLETDLQGRQTLQQLNTIVGELHREEVRRARMMAS